MKKVLIILLVTVILGWGGLFYLNRVVLPVKVKALVVKSLEDFTKKEVSIEAIRLNVFKGLVLRGVRIYDDKETLLKVKEASCGLIIIPFKWQVILPWVKIISPEVLVKRKADNSINLVEIFSNQPKTSQKEKGAKILVSKIAVYNGKIIFKDDSLAPGFAKNIEDVFAVGYLSLPAKIKFKAKFNIPSQEAMKFYIQGEYDLTAQELTAKINSLGLIPKDFIFYYPLIDSFLKQGRIDSLIDLKLKNQVLNAKIIAEAKDFIFKKDKLSIKFNSGIDAHCQYAFSDKRIDYSGKMNIFNTDISGVPLVDKITSINADVKFTKAGLNCDNFNALVLGFPVKARMSIADFLNPVLRAQVQTSGDFISLLPILENKLSIIIPARIKGLAQLGVDISQDLKSLSPPQISGVLGITQGIVVLKYAFFENVSGKINFDLNQMNWKDFNFRFSGVDYKTTGELLNFKMPKVNAQLFSSKLNLNSQFNIYGDVLNITELYGKYLNSDFIVSGNLDSGRMNIKSDLNIALNDLKEVFNKQQAVFNDLKPGGFMRIQADLSGDTRDLKNCLVQAKLSSNTFSLYGLKSNDFSLDYNQENGVGDFSNLRMAFYGGVINALGKINYNSANLPYWVDADIKGVRIEELKADTGLRDKDISGNVDAQFKLNGFSNDISKLSGAGKIRISDGKLWELDLFKGFGIILFTSDFSKIVFKQGHCGFVVQDKYIYTDNLVLTSNITNISGAVKIGFDTSIDATLDAEVSPDVPVTGTLKDVTTAFLGQAGRFGIIRITGNFKEPKYKFKPAVMDIIKGFKDVFFPKE